MVKAKQVLDVHVSKGITRAQSNEHLRCRSAKATEYAMSKGNYDPTRERLNFEIVRGGKVQQVDISRSIPDRITGVDYERAVSTSIVENCHFTDIGGTALLVGTFPDEGFETHVPYTPFHEQELCTGITIRNNLIEEVTNEDWGGVGIGAGYVKNIHIVHNEVCHVNYSGICVGWGWTLQESGMSGNRIEANYVHHFARRLYDAGGLYTLSNQPSSVMRNNRIEHLIDAPYATNDRAFYIYFDEATDGYTVENNWCPSERFDSNRPGPHNVWKKNGPQVDESIKQKAGRVAVDGVSQTRIIIKSK